MFRIGWFSTGRDKAARDILQVVKNKIDSGEIPNARIAYVFCNRELGESKESDLFLEQARQFKIPAVAYSSRKFRNGYYDLVMAQYLDLFFGKIDLAVLAGYMLIVSPEMCKRYKMINLHPALPDGPKGTWQEVIHQLIENKARETGAMMHLVTPELDAGPVITFCKFSMRGMLFDDLWRLIDLFQEEHYKQRLFGIIRNHGLKREFPLIVQTLKLLAEGGTAEPGGLDLTSKIDQIIK